MFGPFLLKTRKGLSKPRDQGQPGEGDASIVGGAESVFWFH
jgi:hypothetical protein